MVSGGVGVNGDFVTDKLAVRVESLFQRGFEIKFVFIFLKDEF